MDKFAEIVSAAHTAATGINGTAEPTVAELKAGNYKKGRVEIHGLKIAIETPAGTRRFGKEDGKPWSVICMAHYGDLEKTRGSDGDPLDVFIGPWPESQIVYAVNRTGKGGSFDEVKLLICFPTEEAALSAYTNSYERGSANIGSTVRCTIDQLKWWIKYGDTTKQLTRQALPYDGNSDMSEITWDSAALPVGTDIPAIIYAMRREDATDGLLLDAVTEADILEDADSVLALDALIVPLNKLERKMTQLQVIMGGVSDGVKPIAMQITPPFKQRGTTNIAVIFELSDGQTVSIFFHNPDTTPNKLTPDDEMVSWKWLLNKKDVTILVAPERGRDLNPREVGRRIMRLADRNSARFAAANVKKAERMQAIETLKTGVQSKEEELAGLQAEIVVLTEKVEVKRRTMAPVPGVEIDDKKIMEAIRWANSERGEYGTDWMRANLPDYLSNRWGVSVAAATAALDRYFAGDTKPAVVQSQATAVPVEGENAEITAILSKHIPALLAAGKKRHGHQTENADKISYEMNSYSDFSVRYHNKGSQGSLLYADKGDYSQLIEAIGAEDAGKIKAIIDAEKAALAAKDASGFYKQHPFNKVTKITLAWSEGSADSNKSFATMEDLNKWFSETYPSSEIRTDGSYSKNKVLITLANDVDETFNIESRIDVSINGGDYNPARGSVQSYLRGEGYDGVTPRKLTNGMTVYAEIPAGGSVAVAEPHYSELVLAELVATYGWRKEKENNKSLRKVYEGGVKGDLNPSGSRLFVATLDERARYLILQHGFKDIFDIDLRGRDPKDAAREFNERAGKHADSTAAKQVAIDPTTPEGYAKVMADEKLQLDHQDRLDSFFQERIVEVRNALRDIGWAGGKGSLVLMKDVERYGKHSVQHDTKNVGAGANVVGVTWLVDGGTSKIQDDLSKTPAQLAAGIDAAVQPSDDERSPKLVYAGDVRRALISMGYSEAGAGNMLIKRDGDRTVSVKSIDDGEDYSFLVTVLVSGSQVHDAQIQADGFKPAEEVAKQIAAEGNKGAAEGVPVTNIIGRPTVMLGKKRYTKDEGRGGYWTLGKKPEQLMLSDIGSLMPFLLEENIRELGVATITDIGEENIYMTKDGIRYFSKVMATERYSVGEHDFSKDQSFDENIEGVYSTGDDDSGWNARVDQTGGNYAVLVWDADADLRDEHKKEFAAIEEAKGYADKIVTRDGHWQARNGDTEEDASVAEAKSFLGAVINGSADMMDSELAERLEKIATDYEGSAEMMDLFNQAAEAYSQYMIAEAQKALGA